MVSNIKNQPSPNTASQTILNTNNANSANDSKRAERAAPTSKAAAAAYAKNANPPTISDAAHVQISQKAREMNQIRKIVDETPDIREDKVAKFKELIAKGEYKVDAGRVADGMLNEAIRDEMSHNPTLD